MRACMRACMHAACAPGAEAETREEKRVPSGSGGRGTVATDGTEAGNTCRQPVRRGGRAAAAARGGEGEAGGGRRAPAPYYLPRPPHARARAQPARPGHRGLRRGPTLARAFPTHLHGPRPASRSPKESSHRQPRDTAASRGPAPERAPPGCGRRRRGSGDGGRGGRRGIGTAPLAPSRGAAAARARPNLAGACGAKTLPDGGASGGTRRGGGTASREGTPASRESPGTNALLLPREGGRPRPLPNDTRSQHPETSATRAPPSRPPPLAPLHSPALRAPGGGGVDEGGGRGCGGRGSDRSSGPSPPRPAPRHTTGVSSPRGSQPTGPRGHDPGSDASHPPPPLDAWTSQSSPPGTARGTEEARGKREEGAPTRARLARAGTEEQGGRGPAGRGAGGRARDARGRGATAAADDARTRLNLGRRRARAGALRTNSQPRDTPSLAGRGGGGD